MELTNGAGGPVLVLGHFYHALLLLYHILPLHFRKFIPKCKFIF